MAYGSSDGGSTFYPLAVDTNGNLQVQGAAAHDAAQAGSPVKIGGVYRSSDPAVANGDAVDLLMRPSGRPDVHIGEMAGHTATQVTADGNIKASAGILYALIISASGVTAGDTIEIKDGSGGSTIITVVFSGTEETIVFCPPVPISFSTAIYSDETLTGGTAYVTGVYD